MTTHELAEATKEFDRTIPLSKTRPLNKQERAIFDKMRRAPAVSIFVTRNSDRVLRRIHPD